MNQEEQPWGKRLLDSRPSRNYQGQLCIFSTSWSETLVPVNGKECRLNIICFHTLVCLQCKFRQPLPSLCKLLVNNADNTETDDIVFENYIRMFQLNICPNLIHCRRILGKIVL